MGTTHHRLIDKLRSAQFSMMAAEADIIRYMITGEDGEMIPENATHVSVHPTVRIIPRRLFFWHQNIIELICHDGVIKIEVDAFLRCPSLKRVIMKGVEEIESRAFVWCRALEYVECDKLEIIGEFAFSKCESMTSFNLPSAKIVSDGAFDGCKAFVDTVFGRKLESIERGVFFYCSSLQRITIPMKKSLIDYDNTFHRCCNLRHVDLVEAVELQQTIEALLWDEWKNDMNAELASINQILPNAPAGGNYSGEKTIVLRRWIRKVLKKIINYKSQHRCLLREAACRLQLALPRDIVMKNVVPFLMLPQHTFDGEDEINDFWIDESIDETYSTTTNSNEEEGDHVVSRGGALDEDEERKQEEANGVGEERRKRQMTVNNGDDVDEENR